MDGLSKIDTVETIDSGLTPSTIPGRCDNAQNGVSVENIPEEKAGHEWFVFRASYGREDKAASLLKELHTEPYIARHTAYIKKKSGVKPVIRKLLPNFVFAYMTKEEARLFTKGSTPNDVLLKDKPKDDQKRIAELSVILSYYYNHFEKDGFGKNPPLTIPYQQMKDFIIATCTEKDVMPIEERQFLVGEEVEVVMGEFKGLRGKVIREQRSKRKLYVQLNDFLPTPSQHDGQRRLLFQLPCLGVFCSALIPTAYFRKIDDGQDKNSRVNSNHPSS